MVVYKCLGNCCKWIPQRYAVATAVMSGLTMQYFHRLAFSVAITDITYPLPLSEENQADACQYNDNETVASGNPNHAEFHWDTNDQALLLSAFFIGYTITHVPGGIIADRFGPKNVMGIGVVVSGVCSLLTPLSARANLYALVGVRAVMGLAQGPMFPAQSTFVARWSLPKERNLINSYENGGMILGAVLANSCTGVFLYHVSQWDYVFYAYGLITFVWLVFWQLFAHDSVAKHPFIKETERTRMIETLSSELHAEYELPLRDILTSVPVWAMTAAQIGNDWGFYILVTLLPQYVSYVLLFDISQSGLLNAMPYICMFIFQMVSAKIADTIVSNGWVSKTIQCKVYLFITNMFPCLCMIGASYAGCDRVVVVVLFTLSMGFMGLIYSCVRVVNVDMSPNHAGFLMALMNGLGSICGFLTPPVFSLFTQEHTVQNWRKAFWLSTGLVFIPTVVFLIWGSAKIQHWNVPSGSRTSVNRPPNEPGQGIETKQE